MKGYYNLRKEALDILNRGLSKKLYYHGIHHTLDALHISTRYLKNENIVGDEA